MFCKMVVFLQSNGKRGNKCGVIQKRYSTTVARSIVKDNNNTPIMVQIF